jgi:tellurite resistance protein TehA-like permease
MTDSRTTASVGNPPGGGLLARVANLSPASFGMVMATGIISLAASMLGLHLIARLLFFLNIAFYVVLCVLSVLRAVLHPARFFGDMIDHRQAPGFLTTVAATAILGSQFMVLAGEDRIGMVLWFVTIVLWVGLTYTIFTAFTVKEQKPTLDQGISGGWLLAVVATQALAMLSALLAARLGEHRLELNFFALSMWLWGGMLYIWMMSLIFYRYTFFRFSPSDLSPPYWINMGAMAISTLVGAQLIINASASPFLQSFLPFLKGFTVFYWATGTWWIPMLLILGVWRHVYKRFPLVYDPLYWGAVFPLGMYAACTWKMNAAMEFNILGFLPPVVWTVALGAWSLAFFGMLFSLLRPGASGQRPASSASSN